MTGAKALSVSYGSFGIRLGLTACAKVAITQRVAVGRALGDRVGADDGAGAGLVVDDHRLAQFAWTCRRRACARSGRCRRPARRARPGAWACRDRRRAAAAAASAVVAISAPSAGRSGTEGKVMDCLLLRCACDRCVGAQRSLGRTPRIGTPHFQQVELRYTGRMPPVSRTCVAPRRGTDGPSPGAEQSLERGIEILRSFRPGSELLGNGDWRNERASRAPR